MEAANQPVPIAQSHYNAEKDKPKPTATRFIRVHNRNTSNLHIGELGANVPIGISDVLVYESEVEQLRAALVENEPHKIDIAREKFENELATEVAADKEDGWHGDVPQLLALMKSKTDPKVNESLDRVLATTEHSLQASFHDLFKRDIKPLISLEPIGESLPALTTRKVEEERLRMSTLAREIAAAVVQAQHAIGENERIATLEKQLAEAKAQIEKQNQRK